VAAPAAQAGHVAADAARQTTQNKYFQLVGRVGLAAYGLVQFTIAYLAAQVALEARQRQAGQGRRVANPRGPASRASIALDHHGRVGQVRVVAARRGRGGPAVGTTAKQAHP
jgi:hypothetical protein